MSAPSGGAGHGQPGQSENSSIVYPASEVGGYRRVATSFEPRGVGSDTLTIREFAATKK